MNITITQDNSRVELLGSNGAAIILKLYDLATDPNNTLTLRGNISTTSAYAQHVEYLNSHYPNLIINATKLYIQFEDEKTALVCIQYFGDGTGCTVSDLATADFTKTINNSNFATAFKNSGATKFNEFKYCTGITNTSVNNTFPFLNNTTLTEFTLPSSCTTISTYTFTNGASGSGSIAPLIHGLNNVRYIENYGFWKWSLYATNNNISFERFELDWRNINGVWNNFYSTDNSFKGVAILPKNPTDAWIDSRDFSIFGSDRGQYITKVVFPETFTCKNCDFTRMNSCNTFIFLTQTPCTNTISMWRNLNWGVGSSNHLYVPKSLYDTMDSLVLADSSYSEKQYTSSIKISYGPTPEPLENYANISDENKDELVSYGCTATGSTGNWTITPPSV